MLDHAILLYSYTYHTTDSPTSKAKTRALSKIIKELAQPWYTDQVLPFDVTIACANEYGAAASAKLFGVEILNEGFGTSVDDSVIEQQATFVARSVEPLQAVANVSLV